MRRLDRYVGGMVFGSILMVLLVLVGLFTFFTFIEEVDDIGTGQYGALLALQYVLLHAPRRAYELFPVAALLGSLLGLGLLGNTSELTVMRASGVSVARILWAAMKMGLVLLFGAVLLGEWVAPASEQHAQKLRALARSEQIALQTPYGFWAREGDNFINVRQVEAGGRLGDVFLYRFDARGHLQSTLHAGKAYYQEASGQWTLENLTQTDLSRYPIDTRTQGVAQWTSLLSPGLAGILILKPDRLSSLELYRYVSYLKENSQRAAQYELALWQRLIYPLTAAVMVFLAVPFVFGSQRSVAVSQRVLVGSVLGVGFYILNQTIGYLGLLYDFDPLLSAALPTGLFLVLGVALTQRRIV